MDIGIVIIEGELMSKFEVGDYITHKSYNDLHRILNIKKLKYGSDYNFKLLCLHMPTQIKKKQFYEIGLRQLE